MPIIKIIRKIDAVLAGCENAGLVSILAFMCIVSFLQVVLRNLWNFGLPWGDEVLRHLVIWVGLLGASLGIREERSIRIDVFNNFLPAWAHRYNEIFINFGAMIICGFLVVASVKFLVMEKEYQELFSTLRIPVWKILVIYPIVFSIICVRFFLNGLAHLTGEKRKEKTPD